VSRILYHATWPDVVDAIEADGFHPGTFLANRPEYAVGFVRLRGGRFKGIREITHEGEVFTVPDYETFDEIVVFGVDATGLEVIESHDHNPSFFPEDLESFIVADVIAPERIVERVHYENGRRTNR